MAWLVLGVLGFVAVTAAVVGPRRARLRRAPGFPWFWVVLPATAVAVAAAVGVFAWPQAVTGAGSFWWDRPWSGPSTLQFLSHEQYQRLVTLRRLRWVLPPASVLGVASCVWAWRQRRV
ncbi:amino acid permease [Rhodococcus sp. SGAir0479]|uniref:amino acid permease n=1 Tax=Rhodococcus sp. SGAir0479 TaxID=2567884 RepID=UPI0010CCD22E|nr:amino acid permease [Rhodococcus sp. SGAir0479]QCQ90538.1 amino acid permease [Rhodococcus sp. SGAir0479]